MQSIPRTAYSFWDSYIFPFVWPRTELSTRREHRKLAGLEISRRHRSKGGVDDSILMLPCHSSQQ